ncbi:hypothetical protein BCR36DRAFT_121041 [Piromyces finnis]|uniref:Uncharacterized protein n=1 Tax=Piromyces finnis TaxID=1754191 RepID=A0A1Y1V3H2_9FUNG|nr:hypothetical protein BCR36DRAFT_121041 [Piromyces finnis]|eukprot:ORX45050.1 hypothetical protein BCR36DRAFT_121041 [Piromyces finnis]
MSKLYCLNKPTLKVALKQDNDSNDSQSSNYSSQSVPSTPLKENINYQTFEKSAYRSLLQTDNSLKKLEEERKIKEMAEEELSSTPQPSQPEYIYSSTSSIMPSFAPKLRRSYSQQLKKMSKSPRLSLIQPKIQPQVQDNHSRNSNLSNRLSTLSTNSVVNSSTNFKIFKQSIQNFNNPNNKKNFLDGIPINYNNSNNSNDDCSSLPASPVTKLRRNTNHFHTKSISNVNYYSLYDGSDRSLVNPECNKFVQSESTIMNITNQSKMFKSNPIDDRNSNDYLSNKNSMEYMNKNNMDSTNKSSMDYMNKNSVDCINENSSLLINLCISGNNVKTSSTNSITPSYTSKASKLKNSIQDESSDNQCMITLSDYGKDNDDSEYYSDNSLSNFYDNLKIPKSKNIPIASKRNSNIDYIENSNGSSYSEKYADTSISNISNFNENRISTINGQQIYPILYSDPSDFNQSSRNNYGNDLYSYIINIKNNSIKEFIETKEKADAEIYEIYTVWLEDKDSNFDNEELRNMDNDIFNGNKLEYDCNNHSSSLSSLLSINYSNGSINIDRNINFNESNYSLFNNIGSINNINQSLTSINGNDNDNESSSIKTPTQSEYSLNALNNVNDNIKESKTLNKSKSSLSTRIQELNEPQRKVFGNKDVNIYKDKIKRNNKGSYFEKLKSSGNPDNKKVLSSSMDCLVLAYSNSTMKNKMFSSNIGDHNSLQNLDYSIYNNIKKDHSNKRSSCLPKINNTSTTNNTYENNKSNYFNNNENFEFYLRPKINQVYSKSWPPSIFTSCHTKLLIKIEQVIADILKTPAEKYIGTSVAINFMKELNDLINEQKSLVVGDPEVEDILTKLLYVYAPVVRISEFYNQYISSIEKLESDELELIKMNKPNISYKRTSKLSSGFNFNDYSDSSSNINSSVDNSKSNINKDFENYKNNNNNTVNIDQIGDSNEILVFDENLKSNKYLKDENYRKKSLLESIKNSDDYVMPKKKSSVSFDIKLQHIKENVVCDIKNNDYFNDHSYQENNEIDEINNLNNENNLEEEKEKSNNNIYTYVNDTISSKSDNNIREKEKINKDVDENTVKDTIEDDKLKNDDCNNIEVKAVYIPNHMKEESTNLIDDGEAEFTSQYKSSVENCSELLNDPDGINDEDNNDHSHENDKSKKTSKAKVFKIKKEKKKTENKNHIKSEKQLMNEEYSASNHSVYNKKDKVEKNFF